MPSQNKPIEDRLDDVLDRIRAGMGPEPSRKAILKLFKSYAAAERLDELERTINYFYDENRESKTVLEAFKKNRKHELQERITQ